MVGAAIGHFAEGRRKRGYVGALIATVAMVIGSNFKYNFGQFRCRLQGIVDKIKCTGVHSGHGQV